MKGIIPDMDKRLQKSVGFEVIFDGWCIHSAERFLLESAGFFLSEYINIPLYIPPQGSANSPYGKAGEDCPYAILSKGTSDNPRFRVTADMSFGCALELLERDWREKITNV